MIEELINWLTENSNEWSLEVNPHEGNYETRESYVKFTYDEEWFEELNDGANLYELRVYPSTPISHYIIFETDLQRILESAKSKVLKHRLDGSRPMRFDEKSRSK